MKILNGKEIFAKYKNDFIGQFVGSIFVQDSKQLFYNREDSMVYVFNEEFL